MIAVDLITNHVPPVKSNEVIEKALFLACFGHLEGGVHDPRFTGPVYIEDWAI